ADLLRRLRRAIDAAVDGGVAALARIDARTASRPDNPDDVRLGDVDRALHLPGASAERIVESLPERFVVALVLRLVPDEHRIVDAVVREVLRLVATLRDDPQCDA